MSGFLEGLTVTETTIWCLQDFGRGDRSLNGRHRSLICRDEVKERCQAKISNRFSALGDLDDNVDINRAWDNIRDNINISAKQSPGHYDLKVA
jgi:hypothetical protein